MRVFVSWSGDRSRAIAEMLREWLPYVLPATEPWMSAADIERGSRWSLDVSEQLDKAGIGIICLTPENLDAPWILFEAGALSKALSRTLVCTYLFQVGAADIKGPLSQFQATLATRDDTRKLLASMNRVLGSNALPDERLSKMFEMWWPELERKLGLLKEPGRQTVPHRPEREILEEILSLQRKTDFSTLVQEIAKLIEESQAREIGSTNREPRQKQRIRSGQFAEIRESALIVDTRPLLGSSGRLVVMNYPLFGTVSDFLDELYAHVMHAVPSYTYGKRWVLKDSASDKRFPEIGRIFARVSLGRDSDDRSLGEVGIEPGMRLEALPLR